MRKATDAALAKLDLSSWAVAFNGAEPIYASTIDSFAAKFAPRGYSPAAMCGAADARCRQAETGGTEQARG